MAEVLDTRWVGLIEVRFTTRDYDAVAGTRVTAERQLREYVAGAHRAYRTVNVLPEGRRVRTAGLWTAAEQLAAMSLPEGAVVLQALRRYEADMEEGMTYQDAAGELPSETTQRVLDGIRETPRREAPRDAVAVDRGTAMRVQEALIAFEADSHHCVACGARNPSSHGEPGWAEEHEPDCAYVALTRALVARESHE